VTTVAAPRRITQRVSSDELMQRLVMAAAALYLVVAVVLPLWALFSRSVQDRAGDYVGLTNFVRYAQSPALIGSAGNSLLIAVLTTLICVALAFLFAYGLTRTCMPIRGAFRMIGLIPLLAPSLLPAISLVYLFGNQGILKSMMMGSSIYGPIGIVIGSVFWTFPHAVMILITALATADRRLYEASEALGASPVRRFLTVTLPGARYGLISAAFVVFTLTITDFGVPKVIGGSFNVLATDVYKQVVGQQNFNMGAVVGIVLLLPALLAFVADRFVQRRQSAQLSARAVPLEPRPSRTVDIVFFLLCATVAIAILAIIGMSAFASVVKFWPYDLSLSLRNYRFDLMDGGGWASYRNSLVMAGLTALFGTMAAFLGAWVAEKSRGLTAMRSIFHFLALLPLAVPGLVLGIGYIFFFNAPGNPLNFLYGTMAILVISTVAHFYSVPHLTAVTALKQIDAEFEAVSSSLKVPVWYTFARVTVPICLPTVLAISMYFFVNAMTTVSAVVFLYSPSTTLASVAVLNMDDAGDVAPAAAMAMMIFLTAGAVRILYGLATMGLLKRTQAWRTTG
jgi:iron(III) transport system permease protein